MSGFTVRTLALSGIVALAAQGCGAHATTITVNGPNDPKWSTLERGAPRALAMAQPGDVIVLEAGAYPELNPGYSVGKAGAGVTIKAAPGSRVTIAGITFSGGGWHVVADEGAITVKGPITVSNSDDVSLEGLEVAGVPTSDLTEMTGVGIGYRNVKNLRVTHCRIHYWEVDFAGLNAKGLVLTDNEFSYTSSDLVHLGGNLSNAQIGRNFFTQAHTKSLTHQDALQIFPTYATEPMDSISIFDNRFIRGKGGSPVQGIFMNGSEDTPYTNLKITGNLVMMGNYWGIGTQSARNFVITRNYVGGYTDALNDGRTMVPWIRVMDSADGLIDSNVATSEPQIIDSRNIKVVDEKSTSLSAPDDLRAANAWWAAKTAANPRRAEQGPDRSPG
jgi:hypothetical protein